MSNKRKVLSQRRTASVPPIPLRDPRQRKDTPDYLQNNPPVPLGELRRGKATTLALKRKRLRLAM
jgi:hypothetical protein